MNELFEAIKGKKFAVFGRAGIDLFCDEVGVKSENSQIFRSDLGGSSANICAGLVKLGSQASLITSVSDDAIGRFALNRLRDYGVDTKYVKTISGECRTSLAFYSFKQFVHYLKILSLFPIKNTKSFMLLSFQTGDTRSCEAYILVWQRF